MSPTFVNISRFPSFLEGLARALDLGGSLWNLDEEPVSDADALASDWQAVGNDMYWALGRVPDLSIIAPWSPSTWRR